MKIKELVSKLKVQITQVYVALGSKATPWYAKVIAALTVAYALSPIDLIPDFIPVLGYLDDIIILPVLIWICIKLIPVDIWNSYEEKAKDLWKDGKPTKWYFSIPIIILWLFVVVITGKYIYLYFT